LRMFDTNRRRPSRYRDNGEPARFKEQNHAKF
jgi:hypothetical protein